MNDSSHSIRIGTRASALARWQTEYEERLLKKAWMQLEISVQMITTRGDQVNSRDALISRDSYTLTTLPRGAMVRTSSRRRAAQLLHRRPDLRILDIRGNVDTRIRETLDKAH